MDNALIADVFSAEEKPVITKPAFFIRNKVIINSGKTLLFLFGITAMIVNQSKKNKTSNIPAPPDPIVITTNHHSAIIPFDFLR